AVGEIISPIMASKQGFGQFPPPPGSPRAAALRNALLAGAGQVGGDPARAASPLSLEVIPAGWDPIQARLAPRLSSGPAAACNYAAAKTHEIRFASLALALADNATTTPSDREKAKEEAKKKEDDKDKQKDKGKEKPKEIKLPEDFLGQAIKETVMHEV